MIKPQITPLLFAAAMLCTACNVKDDVNTKPSPTKQDMATDLESDASLDMPDLSEMAEMTQQRLSVRIEPTELELMRGRSAQLTATVVDDQGAIVDEPITWSVDNELVLSVDQQGLVTALADGQTTITATTPGASASITITVSTGDFKAIAVGNEFSCALDPDNALWCWGENKKGQLGNGALIPETRPTRIETGLTFVSLHGSTENMCALTIEGQAYCWGKNDSNQLATGGERVITTPTAIQTDVRFSTLNISAYRACGISRDTKNLYCWGNAFNIEEGKLNQLTGYACTPKECQPDDMSCQPVICPPDIKVDAVSVSDMFSFEFETNVCAISDIGEVWCWNNGWVKEAFFGFATIKQRFKQTPMRSIVQGGASESTHFACGVSKNDDLYCWGKNDYGQLGTGDNQDTLLPAKVDSDVKFASVKLGYQHACAVSVDRELYCWGRGEFGMLGNGTFKERFTPSKVNLPDRVISVDVSQLRTCALTEKEQLFCWGVRGKHSLGAEYSDRQPLPQAVDTDETFARIHTGVDHACGRTTQGKVLCWGDGRKAQIATTTLLPTMPPTPIDLPGVVSQIAVAGNATCARLDDQSVYCWGDNELGASGIGDNQLNAEPVKLFIKAKHLTAYHEAMCAITDDDTLKCWGTAPWFDCNNQTRCVRPTTMHSGTTFKTVALGRTFACGVNTNNQTLCWGENKNGQLGKEPLEDSMTPVEVNTTTTFRKLRLGRDTAIAQVDSPTNTGAALWSWGGSSHGQRLDTMTGRRSTPEQVTNSNFSRRVVLDFTTTGNLSCVVLGQESSNAPYTSNLFCQGYSSGAAPTTNEIFDARTGLKKIDAPFTWTKISLGYSYGCGIDNQQKAFCWGSRRRGILGNGTNAYISSPVRIEP